MSICHCNENVDAVVEAVVIDVRARLTALKEAIKTKSYSHLGGIDVGDMELWQGEHAVEPAKTAGSITFVQVNDYYTNAVEER